MVVSILFEIPGLSTWVKNSKNMQLLVPCLKRYLEGLGI